MAAVPGSGREREEIRRNGCRSGAVLGAFWRDLSDSGDNTARFGGFFKERAHMDVVQIVGNPDMKVERVSVLVGGGSLGLAGKRLLWCR